MQDLVSDYTAAEEEEEKFNFFNREPEGIMWAQLILTYRLSVKKIYSVKTRHLQ